MPLRSRIQKLKNSIFDPSGFSLPEGTRAGPTDISLCGDRSVEISLCFGILEYSCEKIGVKVKEGKLEVYGEGLSLKTYRDRRIAVCGRIKKIIFND